MSRFNLGSSKLPPLQGPSILDGQWQGPTEPKSDMTGSFHSMGSPPLELFCSSTAVSNSSGVNVQGSPVLRNITG